MVLDTELMVERHEIELKNKTVCVIGLGYVGFPLAEQFSKYFNVVGFDINQDKVDKLSKENKKNDNFVFTTNTSEIKKADFVIIAVPTPITKSKEPDLSFVKSASKLVGQNLKKGAIVVSESTVYPGVTEEIVGPILEQESKMILGTDFKIGYSPERVNPGDKNHTIDKITKIVSGMDEETTAALAELYGSITTVYKTSDIKTAEAAKVIENVQRDLNIALVNELSIMFNKMDIDTKAVLDAASTKWNFHRFDPGLVGGHCIPVDPYYLVYKAKEIGYNPQVILAGRSVNDSMPKHVVDLTVRAFNDAGKVLNGSKVLIMGLTFKENVEDTRETPVKSIIKELKEYKCKIFGFDPMLSREQIEGFGVNFLNKLEGVRVDCVIVAVAHDEFKKITLDDLKEVMKGNGTKPILVDVRGMFGKDTGKNGFIYRRL